MLETIFEFIRELDDESLFYVVAVILTIPAGYVALKFGLFMTLPKFLLKAFLMEDYNKKRARTQKRKDKEEKKRKS